MSRLASRGDEGICRRNPHYLSGSAGVFLGGEVQATLLSLPEVQTICQIRKDLERD
jgi:hypothetical protein